MPRSILRVICWLFMLNGLYLLTVGTYSAILESGTSDRILHYLLGGIIFLGAGFFFLRLINAKKQ